MLKKLHYWRRMVSLTLPTLLRLLGLLRLLSLLTLLPPLTMITLFKLLSLLKHCVHSAIMHTGIATRLKRYGDMAICLYMLWSKKWEWMEWRGYPLEGYNY